MSRVRALLSMVRNGWSDPLLRGSLYLMIGTVLTGGLGFVFWTLAARTNSATDVGLAASAVAAATAISLAVHLGPAALLIERLPRHEGTPRWGQLIWTTTLGTTVISAVLAAGALVLLDGSAAMGELTLTSAGGLLTVAGCAAWSGSNVLLYAFVGARRSDQTAASQALISVLKLVLLAALALTALDGVTALVSAWSLSAVLGMTVALGWQVHRVGQRLGRPRFVRPTSAASRSMVGHHLTSAGGVLTPYLLPPLVAATLSAADNAYFYLTWMLGSLFFMVSPSISASLFAEGVRNPAGLPAAVRSTARLITLLLAGPVVITLVFGHLILSVFGADYAREGYLLLVLLVLSTAPDAVTNVAIGLFRATGELWRSTVLNIGMAVVTLVASAVLMPRMGIEGVGVAWLGAQVLGTIWVLPRLRTLLREAAATPAVPSPDEPVVA
jgi:O-antigen/teichoic acid export membrane protein